MCLNWSLFLELIITGFWLQNEKLLIINKCWMHWISSLNAERLYWFFKSWLNFLFTQHSGKESYGLLSFTVTIQMEICVELKCQALVKKKDIRTCNICHNFLKQSCTYLLIQILCILKCLQSESKNKWKGSSRVRPQYLSFESKLIEKKLLMSHAEMIKWFSWETSQIIFPDGFYTREH